VTTALSLLFFIVLLQVIYCFGEVDIDCSNDRVFARAIVISV